MLRQVSIRNHRAKGGFRAKNALQISTFVAVGIWLIYQMKYSHDHRKAYEDKLDINARQSELTSFGRKEEAEHGEIKEKAREEAEPSEQKSQIAQKVVDQEHEEHSHESREKSFRGDDASSEVVHNTREAERDERTRKARERSFKADDASSAVDHVVPLKDSEPEIGMFVPVREKNTSSVQFNQTLPENSRAAANETALEDDEHASPVRTDESGEQPSELETLDRIYNETGVLKFHANESESQDELGLRSRENVQKDYTVIPKNSTRAQSNQTTVVDPTIVARDLRNLTAAHPLHTSTEAAKLEVPTTKNEVMVKKSDDQNLKTSAL